MIFKNYDEAVSYITDVPVINFTESFALSQLCSRYLFIPEKENEARDIIIRVQDAWEKVDKGSHSLWNDLTEAAGLYPYLEPTALSNSAILRYEYHKSSFLNDVYLHQEQQKLSIELLSGKSVVVSAPTSFGKSLLIEEVIASKIYKQIVIIQPTLALLDETRKKLVKYKDSYKVIVSTSQEPDEQRGNIFLFTGERVVEYGNFSAVDFFVIDEFYKLSINRDDDRAIVLNQAFHKLLKFTDKFYLLGPMIKSIPENFNKKFDFLWYPTDYATVAVDEINMEVQGKFNVTEKRKLKKQKLFELLIQITEPTLIYCSSPNRATQLANEYSDYFKEVNGIVQNNYPNSEMIEWISENLHSEWTLKDALKYKIAFHHGALPRHLGSSIVDAFNETSVKFLFCTSTLIEGVNTSAKNVILFDKEKGKKKIDFFDYKNISGRSGRMNKHFIGNVIRFEKQPDQMELFVDIPLFNQENAPLEILVSLNDNEIEENVKSKLDNFNNLPEDLKELLRKNSSISIEGQLNIIKALQSNPSDYNRLMNWKGYAPSFDSLSCLIELCWNNLTKPEERGMYIDGIGRLSARWLASFTFTYITHKSIKAVISHFINDAFWQSKIPDNKTRINVATFSILHITRHWFDYKLPKWLSIMSDIQEYVFTKLNLPVGNYIFLASSLEHGFLAPNVAALMEYDIPISAINKLQKINNLINDNMTSEVIINRINSLKNEDMEKVGLLKYEINKIRKSI